MCSWSWSWGTDEKRAVGGRQQEPAGPRPSDDPGQRVQRVGKESGGRKSRQPAPTSGQKESRQPAVGGRQRTEHQSIDIRPSTINARHSSFPIDTRQSTLDTRPIPTRLSEQQFWALADVPAEAEWFANIRNRHTRRAYKLDVHDFLNFNGIDVAGIRAVTRPHVIAWRKELEKRELAASTVRRKLSAVSALFEYLCESNAIYLNPVNGVERPAANANEGKTPAIGDAQARALLACPDNESLKGKRDGAILATFLYHGLRAEELVKLKVKDVQERRGVKHFRVHGKGSKIRYVPVHPAALDRIDAYTAAARTGEPAFSEADLARAQLIRDLKQGMGVNDEGVGIILNLLDQMHSLRKVIAEMMPPGRERSTPLAPGSSIDLDQG